MSPDLKQFFQAFLYTLIWQHEEAGELKTESTSLYRSAEQLGLTQFLPRSEILSFKMGEEDYTKARKLLDQLGNVKVPQKVDPQSKEISQFIGFMYAKAKWRESGLEVEEELHHIDKEKTKEQTTQAQTLAVSAKQEKKRKTIAGIAMAINADNGLHEMLKSSNKARVKYLESLMAKADGLEYKKTEDSALVKIAKEEIQKHSDKWAVGCIKEALNQLTS